MRDTGNPTESGSAAPQSPGRDGAPADPFRWLEDGGSADVAAWEDAQRALLDDRLDRDGLRAAVHRHLVPHLRVGAYSAPQWRAGRAVYLRHEPGHDQPVLVRADGVRVEDDARARTVFDPLAWDPSGDTVLTGWFADSDGSRVAVHLSSTGDGTGRIAVIDTRSGAAVEPPLTGCRSVDVAWLPGGEGFYYVRDSPDRGVPRRAVLHRIGAPQERDTEVEGAGPANWSTQRVQIDPSGRWLLVQARGPQGIGVWVGELPEHGAAPARVAPVYAATRCTARFRGAGRLDVVTDHHAPRGRLLSLRLGGDAQWREAVPERSDAVLVDAVGLGAGLDTPFLTLWRADGASRLRLHGDGSAGHPDGRDVALPGVGTVRAVGTDPDDTGSAWIEWTDFVTPPSVLRYRVGDASACAVLTAPGAARAGAVRCDRYEAPSTEGVRVGTFVIGPGRGSGPAPTLLTVYGGFGLANTPTFSAAALAWVAAGGRWAMAAVRGGGEEGGAWREAARGRGKYRSVQDLHAAAEYLVGAGVAESGRIALLGSSHGGLLAAAAAVDRPDAYAAAVCTAAPLDLMRFPHWPAGRVWIPEYGDPADPGDRAALLRYSPYHNVGVGTRYPAMLLTAYELDQRVDPAHARKFCAALQTAAAHGPEETSALYALRPRLGHTTQTTAAKTDQARDEFAFLARALGLRVPPP